MSKNGAPLKVGCGYCDFTSESPDEMVLHMFTTGHGLATGLKERMQESGLVAELTEVIRRVQADPECGEPVTEEDFTDEDREIIERLKALDEKDKGKKE